MDFDPAPLKGLYYACLSASGSKARGAALEDLVEHVFLHAPSVKLFKRDVLDEDGSQEIDFIFTHFQHMSLIPIQDVTILIECKNEKRKSTSSQVLALAMKIKSRSLRIGILVTTAGLSGARGKAGHEAIKTALNMDVAIIVVLTAELLNLTTHDDLSALLVDRLAELQTFREYRSV